MFIGTKMLLAYWVHISAVASLAVISAALITSVIASVVLKEKQS
jgi:predicted tellurium resistance membrane protein TerC